MDGLHGRSTSSRSTAPLGGVAERSFMANIKDVLHLAHLHMLAMLNEACFFNTVRNACNVLTDPNITFVEGLLLQLILAN